MLKSGSLAMISVNVSISNLTGYVLEYTKHLNCGSSLASLIPAVMFLWNLRGLAHTFLKSLNGQRRGNINRFGQYFLYFLKVQLLLLKI